MMTIPELRKKKKEAEAAILEIVTGLENEGVEVRNVWLTNAKTISEPRGLVISVSVDLIV